MNVQQNELSKSYAESLSSYLNDDNNEDEVYNFDPHQRRPSYRSTDMSIASPYRPTPSIASNHRLPPPPSSTDSDSDEESLTNHQATPLPKLQMFIISIMLFSDPLTSTILLPFIYFMIKDFHLSDDEKEIGTYAGWITSIFFLAQFCTAILWGRFSDRRGRRPVLLIGLIGNSISSCLFGLSQNLWWAIASRALCGIMNGNGGVARSMICEITDSTNRAKAFSIFGFCWGIGMIGPALGGFLCKPAEHFPSVFGDIQFFIDFPYFLPCFISSLGSLVGFVIGFLYLQESNPAVIARRQEQTDKASGYATNGGDNESTPLLSTPTPPVKKSSTHPFLAIKSVGRNSAVTILAYSIFAFHAMVFDEVLPLYFSSPTDVGGLGSTAPELAKILSVCGLWQLIGQFYLFPWINKRYDTLGMTRASLLLFFVSYALFPELTTYKDWLAHHVASETSGSGLYLLRAGYLVLLLLRVFGNCLAFTCLMVMTSNSAGPGMLGTINGLLQSCLSLVRAFGPTVGGTLWSFSLKYNVYPFDRHLVYYLIAFLALVNYFQSFCIPRSLALGGNRR